MRANPTRSVYAEPVPFGVRHLALAALIALFCMVYADLPLPQSAPKAAVELARLWATQLLQTGLPLLWLVRRADVATARGASAWLAYGGTLLLVLLWGKWLMAPWLELLQQGRVEPDLARRSGESLQLFLPLALALGAYAQWRSAQLSAARLSAWQLEGVRARSELQATRLQALQARVDPGELLQRLRGIAERAGQDAAAADEELVELIAQLRARQAAP